MAKSSEVLAVDIDDVSLHYSGGFSKFCNRVGWTDGIKPEEYSENWSEVWGIEDPAEIQRRTDVMNRGMNPYLRPVRGAQLALTAISKRRDLVILTSRPRSIHETTKMTIDRHFPGIFSAIYYLDGGWGNKGASKVTKGEAVLNIGASALIDDQVRHAKSVAEAGGKGLLFGQNKNNAEVEEGEGLIKVPTWKEVLEVLDIDSESVFPKK